MARRANKIFGYDVGKAAGNVAQRFGESKGLKLGQRINYALTRDRTRQANQTKLNQQYPQGYTYGIGKGDALISADRIGLSGQPGRAVNPLQPGRTMLDQPGAPIRQAQVGGGLLPLQFGGGSGGTGYGGGGGGGGSVYGTGITSEQQAQIDAEKAAIQAARDRYMQYYAAQKAEMDRQLAMSLGQLGGQRDELGRQFGTQSGQISDSRAAAGRDAAAGRTTLSAQDEEIKAMLGDQNITGQADINRRTQASGIFDSSARVGAIGQTQKSYETGVEKQNKLFNDALTSLNTKESDYYKNLDFQLNELKSQYDSQQRQLEADEADLRAKAAYSGEEMEYSNFDKIQQFDDAQRQLDAQIASLRQEAVNKANTQRSNLQRNRQGENIDFFKDIASISNSLQGFALEDIGQVSTSIAQQYGTDGNAVFQRVVISQAPGVFQGTDANRKREFANLLIQWGLDPKNYGYAG